MDIQLIPEVQLKPQHKLVMSRRMKRQLELLRMTQQEVRSLCYEALYSNPMLEIEAYDGKSDELFERIEIVTAGEEDGWEEAHHEDREAGNEQIVLPNRRYILRDELFLQLSEYDLTEYEWKICTYLITSLDRKGYFTENMEEFCACHQFDMETADRMLHIIQSLEPTGIGARNLQECLLLQLEKRGNCNAYLAQIIQEHMEVLAQNNIPLLAKRLGISIEETQRYCDEIKALSPIPTIGYDTGEEIQYVIPDARISVNADNSISILLNHSVIPRLALNTEYCNMLEKEMKDARTRDYLVKQRADAKKMIADVGMRQNTLLRILQCIAGKQMQFFRDGRTLVPMTMSEIAEAADMHVSTVSRAVNEKYILCRAGAISLRSLFVAGYEKHATGQNISNSSVKQKIMELIKAEDKQRPLTDDQISNEIQGMGIKISRRTVAKYREELQIPSSAKRKHYH